MILYQQLHVQSVVGYNILAMIILDHDEYCPPVIVLFLFFKRNKTFSRVGLGSDFYLNFSAKLCEEEA